MASTARISIVLLLIAVSLQKCFTASLSKQDNTFEEEVKIESLQLDSLNRQSRQTEDYKTTALDIHNSYRRQCGSNEVKLNTTLNQEAQKWANFQLNQKSKKLAPLPERPPYNVLFFTQNTITEGSDAVKVAIEGWYKDKKSYNWETPKASGYSEIIWKETTDIGVGFATREGKTVVAVSYWPPGNVYLLGSGDRGKFFKENVPKQC